MSNKEILLDMIENLNEDGLSLLASLFGDMSSKERYNKNTTAERLEEIRLESLQKEEETDIKREEESLERSRESYRKMQDKIKNLPLRYRRLFKKLDEVSLEAGRYSMELEEVLVFDDVYNSSLLCGAQRIYLYGFMKGQICEKRRCNNLTNIEQYQKNILTA